MSEPNLLWDVVDELRQTHAGYMRQAYGFVIDALNETVEALPAIRRRGEASSISRSPGP